ncbi:MAG: o-succinylbenzoate synthase [Mangrovibacterium sp.]
MIAVEVGLVARPVVALRPLFRKFSYLRPMNASITKHELLFKELAKTSRETLRTRPVWHLSLEENGIVGTGECAPLFGLSHETEREVLDALEDVCQNPMYFVDNLAQLDAIPSVKFALEMAWLDWKNGGTGRLFESDFLCGKRGIPINGLIWMNDAEHMLAQIEAKLAAGFSCIKLKIGALGFKQELRLIEHIRQRYTAEQITIRVDANGGFAPHKALAKLRQLAEYDLHSIEQPIRAGNWAAMASLCEQSPLPIALDEELIGVLQREDKQLLLDLIRPQYLVLKPSLHGGFSSCDEWIQLAEERGVSWWGTSYLESNVGLSAIAQWAATKKLEGHQGLGTGQLFSNNFPSPLRIEGERLLFH